MPQIADLPVELFLDGILSFLPVRDVLSFGAANRFFNAVAADEAFWHRRIQQDFNFSGADTARRTGWKFLYKRLSHPEVYVWGEKSQGRLGLANPPRSNVRDGLPYPVRLQIPGNHIVSLVAGGMSFHALDSQGNIYVWGALDGTNMGLRSDGFSEPSKKAESPMRLMLPSTFRSLSCGRLHLTALDAASQVWTFTSWGRPFRLNSPLVDRSSADSTPVQVESGWMFSSILTESGDVLVYWPFIGSFKELIDEKMQELDSSDDEILKAAAKARPTDSEPDVVPCHWWVLQGVDPVRLPPIPVSSLPELQYTGIAQDRLDEETKLVKIASLDNNIIGLTNKGHVLRYGELYDEERCHTGRWEYLPLFSDVAQIRDRFPPSDDSPSTGLDFPDIMLITHISAAYETFFAYSVGDASSVLMGKDIPAQSDDIHHHDPFINNFAPIIIPELQNQAVISVVLGDYHYGALTATGKLFTWGQFSKGALGLGDPMDIEPGLPGGFLTEGQRVRAVAPRFGLIGTPPDVRVPTEVRFDHGSKRERLRYCFAAAASGWHTGALVIDLDDENEDELEDEVEHVPGSFPIGSDESDGGQDGPSAPGDTMAHIMPIGFGSGREISPFRVGFAGRGVHRGGHPPAGN